MTKYGVENPQRLPKISITNFPRLAFGLLLNLVEHIPHRGYEIIIDDESVTHLAIANQELANGQCFLIGKHSRPAEDDVDNKRHEHQDVQAVLALYRILTNAREVVVPIAVRHAQKMTRLLNLAEKVNLHFLPVPQTDAERIGVTGENGETSQDPRIAHLFNEVDRRMEQPGMVYAITPEGTRSPTLKKFKNGIARACLNYPDRKILIVAIYYDDLKRKMYLRAAKPLAANELFPDLVAQFSTLHPTSREDKPQRDQLLLQVNNMLGGIMASMLPEEIRGDYAGFVSKMA